MSSGALRPAGALANTDKVYGETACGAVGVCANTGATIPHIHSAGASSEAYAFIVHFLLRLTSASRGLAQKLEHSKTDRTYNTANVNVRSMGYKGTGKAFYHQYFAGANGDNC
jgi:hypothetical protein